MNIELIIKEFNDLEHKHFNIINSYILAKVNQEDYRDFTLHLFGLRKKLDEFQPKDTEELYKIAGMKSRVQHFITDTIEDEEVIKSLFT